MKCRQSTDRAAIKFEIEHLRQIDTEAEIGIGQGIGRRIRQLESKLEANPKPSNEGLRELLNPKIPVKYLP